MADEYSDTEESILELLEEKGEMLQSDIWKQLDLNSSDITDPINRLEEDGVIEREKEGRSYTVKLTNPDLDFSLLMAGNKISPFVNNDNMDPYDEEMDRWIFELSEEYHEE